MTVCSRSHAEVCYDEGPRNSAQCPCCEMAKRISELRFTIERLESEADDSAAD